MPSPTPTPNPSPTPTPTPSPTPTPTPEPDRGSFALCKYHDHDADGYRDTNDEGLDWDFEYRVNGGSWIHYSTGSYWWEFWDDDGCGKVVTLETGDYVEVRELGRSGWKPTTPEQVSFSINANTTQSYWFGNVQEEETTSHDSRCVGLSVSPSSGTAPVTVRFNGTGYDSEGSIQEYRFSFGDESGGQPGTVTQSESEAYHRYEQAGTFTASLAVKDSKGEWQSGANECTRTVTVYPVPQVQGVTTEPTSLPKSGFGLLEALVGLSGLVGMGWWLQRRVL